jgi:hypothetical protein
MTAFLPVDSHNIRVDLSGNKGTFGPLVPQLNVLRPCLARDITGRIIDQIIVIIGCDCHNNPLSINQGLLIIYSKVVASVGIYCSARSLLP